MPFNTITVSGAIAPALISTYLSHYLNHKSLKQKPTAHISYHEGIELIREFLHYASHHTVEEIQAFTSQWVPSPRWVKVDEVVIPEDRLTAAATALERQLGPEGIRLVGGRKWWQWRKPESRLMAEWIEMRGDYNRRKKAAEPGNRVMLYVHGGAYFFGSVDEHRYQMQRHARKLKARVLAPRYRLAPQFPFPCGLFDCLAAYLYLLSVQESSTIVLAGDSAGGGMIVSLLVILRDQGIPLPAGAILISPWVDLTHSFPSVAGDNPMDYIPPHGFLHRPSAAWPPPNSDDLEAIKAGMQTEVVKAPLDNDAALGFSIQVARPENHSLQAREDPAPRPNHNLSIVIDGDLVEIKDQIQMYTTNQLLSHPLVSPALQPSLGGLPPLLILTGGGEVLRDEQIYLAHKAANPKMYPPGESFLDLYPGSREAVSKWKGTDVQLQVWDDLCHVAPTLSFTRPAKYMYRSIAQFGAWALARAQMTEIEILDDDDVSIISGASDLEETDTAPDSPRSKDGHPATRKIGKAGDTLPAFQNHMIRQRVDCYGLIYDLAHPSKLPALQLPPHEVGIIKEGPVRRWMNCKREWDTKFAREKRAVQKKRAAEMAHGYEFFADEVPPPSALAGRRERGVETAKEKRKSRSWGMSIWSLWGSKHDKLTIVREEQADKEPEVAVATPADGGGANATASAPARPAISARSSRSHSRRRAVTDAGQTGGPNEDSPLAPSNTLSPPLPRLQAPPQVRVHAASSPPSIASDAEADSREELERPFGPLRRPFFDGIAIPFTLRRLGDPASAENRNASLITLASAEEVRSADDGGAVEGHVAEERGLV